MNNQEVQDAGFPKVWDNTMRQLSVQCPRKLYFFLRRLDYANVPAYFVWGQAWGEILNVWYSEPEAINDPQSDAYIAHSKASLDAGLAHWDAHGILDAGVNKRGSFEPIWKHYLESYPFEEWRVVEEGGEAGWTFPLRGTDWELGGALDAYIEWPSFGMCVREDKTTGDYITDNYVESWAFSNQVTGYIWVLSNIIGDTNVGGCLMNLVTKRTPGPRSKWTTPRLARPLEYRSPQKLLEFEEQFSFDIHRFKRDYWDRWYWPRSVEHSNCAGGAGKAPCLFKRICASDVPVEDVNAANFSYLVEKEDKWEPWTRSGKQIIS